MMLHAMRCMDVVCDDALPSSHEYQEQVESKTAAMMRRICANLDKQKMSGSSKCKKLHVYLDNSEVLAECIAELCGIPRCILIWTNMKVCYNS